MADVFISYKREEKHLAQRLHDALEQFGFSVWFDVELLSGDEFRPVIKEMIDKCSAVVVLWSSLSVQSQFVIDEAGYAQRQGKLCPALLEPCEIPFGFGGAHADSLEGWTGQLRHDGFNRLLGSIERLTGRQAQLGAPTPESARQRAEITAFQAAAKLRSAAAWKTFLTDYPGTSFRRFIESQMRELQSAAPASMPETVGSHTTEAHGPTNTVARSKDRARETNKRPFFLLRVGKFQVTAMLLSAAFCFLFLPALFLTIVPKKVVDEGIRGPERDAAAAAWSRARSANTVSAYETYLQDYPGGANASDALVRIAVLTAAIAAPRDTFRTGQTFRDALSGGGQGPEMVVIPAGSFVMGSPEGESGRGTDEGPQRTVRINYQFAVGKTEVTWAEWEACVADGGCDNAPVLEAGGDNGWGRGNRPVIEVDWNDAQAYADWLSRKTGERYRLLSEAEWEYVARAGTTGRFSWGDGDPVCSLGASNAANYRSCTSDRTEPVGFSAANAFGLHDMHGNVWEWVEDCYVDSYSGAPTDGSARIVSDCSRRVLRGGSWGYSPQILRSANRDWNDPAVRDDDIGFRVARTL